MFCLVYRFNWLCGLHWLLSLSRFRSPVSVTSVIWVTRNGCHNGLTSNRRVSGNECGSSSRCGRTNSNFMKRRLSSSRHLWIAYTLSPMTNISTMHTISIDDCDITFGLKYGKKLCGYFFSWSYGWYSLSV